MICSGLAVQNPARKGAGNPGLDEKADYSEEQQKQFEGTPGASPVAARSLTHQTKLALDLSL